MIMMIVAIYIQFARYMEDNDKNKDKWEKMIWKDATRVWIVVPKNSLYKLNISSAMLTKLASHPL